MGFFSWKTSDTEEEIWNMYTGRCKPVYLYCPNGDVIEEPFYQGYGVFGGKDAYALLARWNRPIRCIGDDEVDRGIGIEIGCYGEQHRGLEFPLKFSFSPGLSYDRLLPAGDAEYQGFFEPEGEDFEYVEAKGEEET